MKLDLPPLFLFYFFWHPFLALLPSRSNSSSPVPTLPAQPAQCGGRAAPMEHGAMRGGHQLLRHKRRGRQKYQPKTQRKHLCGLESPSDEEPLSQELSRAHLLSPSWWERLVITGGRPWWSSIQPWSSPPASSFPAQNPFSVFNHPSHFLLILPSSVTSLFHLCSIQRVGAQGIYTAMASFFLFCSVL